MGVFYPNKIKIKDGKVRCGKGKLERVETRMEGIEEEGESDNEAMRVRSVVKRKKAASGQVTISQLEEELEARIGNAGCLEAF